MLDDPDARAWLDAAGNPVAFVTRLLRLARGRGLALARAVAAACDDAEVIVFSPLGLPALHVAEALRVPAVGAPLVPATPTRAFPLPIGAVRDLGAAGNRLSYRAGQVALDLPFRSDVNRWRTRELGLRPLRGRDVFARLEHRRAPVLYGFSTHLVPRPDDWGPHLHVTGRWTLPGPQPWQPPEPLASFLAAGPPPVFVGLGSMAVDDPGLVARTVRTAARLAGVRLLLSRGWAGLDLGPDPDDPDVLTVDEVPHDRLFGRCRGVVHHGGAGTTHTAATTGVPSMALPVFADQHFWGRRLAASGVGPRPLPLRRLEAHAFAGRLRTLCSGAHDDAATALGRRLRSEDGAGRAAEVLQRVLGDPDLAARTWPG